MEAPPSPSPALARLYHVEKKIVQVLELAGAVMEELANPTGPTKDVIASQCVEFMRSVKEIQTVLHEEIKAMCEYRPYENCDYLSRIASEMSVKKLDCVLNHLGRLQSSANEYKA